MTTTISAQEARPNGARFSSYSQEHDAPLFPSENFSQLTLMPERPQAKMGTYDGMWRAGKLSLFGVLRVYYSTTRAQAIMSYPSYEVVGPNCCCGAPHRSIARVHAFHSFTASLIISSPTAQHIFALWWGSYS